MKQQIVVITGENVVEDGVVIDQESDQQYQEQPQRIRKQQIEVISATESEKKAKIEVQLTAGARLTRSNSKASETTTRTQDDITLKDEDSTSNDQIEDMDDSIAQPIVHKRKPGRPPKNPSTVLPSATSTPIRPAETSKQPSSQQSLSDDESSPQRKSARIANK